MYNTDSSFINNLESKKHESNGKCFSRAYIERK